MKVFKTVGGIVGASTEEDFTISDCYNKGKILSTYSGEVIGYLYNECNIYNLFYLSRADSLERAIKGKNDDVTKKIMETEADLTFEAFKTWILEQ